MGGRKNRRFSSLTSEEKQSGGCASCIWTAAYLVIFFVAGGYAVNYLLMLFAHTAIPFIWAGVAGMIIGPVVVSVAIVVAILHAFHVI